MRTLIHITDLHFGKITPGALGRLEEQIGLTRPDMCIVSGDLTMRARPHEWHQARAFLNRLPVPYMVVPGNHDLPYFNLWERFRQPYRRFQTYINEDLDPTYTDEVMAIMGINTARSWVPHYTWKEGSISAAQIKRANTFFKNNGDRIIKIVFTHHPFLPPPQRPRTYLVRNARPALEAFETSGVDLLLGGHLHLPYSGDISSFHKQIRRAMICIQGSTATSTRLRQRAPNGYSRIQLYMNKVAVINKQWTGTDYDDAGNAEYCRTETGWKRKL